MSVFVVGIDMTIVNVALPVIRRGLGASVSGLQWTIDAYTLVIACLLPMSGSMADRLGRRRAFQAGLVLFSAGSLLCSLAPGLGWLIAFRAVQAAGGSLLNPVAMAIIVTVFPEPGERARAVGVWGSVAGLSLAAGPVLGGFLVGALGWRSIFWINVPAGIAAIALTRRFVPESRSARPRRLDPLGQALVVVLLVSVTAAIIEGPRPGWSSAPIITLCVVAAASAAALVAAETRHREPLIDMRLFRNAPFCGAMLIAMAYSAALGGFLFLNTLYLQDVRGDSALGAGVRTIPMAVALAVSATVSGRLVAAKGPRLPLVLAGTLQTTGALMFLRLDAHTPAAYLVGAYIVIGTGFGLVTGPVTGIAMSGLPADQAGMAAALTSTGRQFGAAAGVAVTGSVIAAHAGTAFVAAGHLAWSVIAGCAAVVPAAGAVVTSRWATRTARRGPC
ncbi:MFS transporter [Actinomadura macrotermitis]|uniref:Multidrug resistance protein Stp n=1 Tax=Actinomadura macrotermitis TaxID=2585200 RepID=A0A7K0C6Q8_9ACTN|nr:MFS transporter [Actinomadura macrotermitis]MQY08772.1 Multidrug resistance protein Stp [Actinomadura macrotermitis]